MRPKIFLSLFLLFNGLAFGQGSTSYSGYIDLYYMAHLSDNSLINLPYRMFDLTIQHQNENLEIYADLAMEYTPKSHSHFLSSSTPQDFLWDLRELYLTWYTNFGEIKIGKQIHTWGSVDENSPLDVVNAFDYYYLFFQGSDRKLGSYSAALNVYFNNWKFGAVVSPFHQTNRFPLNDPAFPIRLPTTPEEKQIIDLKENPFEMGAFIERSFGIGDLRFSFFQGYDRVFNLSGVNGFSIMENDGSFTKIGVAYGYRKTKLLGLGAVTFIDDFSLRGDLAIFQTKDINESVKISSPFLTHPYHYEESPIHELADYYQFTLQFEYGLPWDISITGQFFSYDTLHYEADDLPIDEDTDLQNLDMDLGPEVSWEDLKPKNFFNPGMGAPLAVLSKRTILLNLEKTFLDDQLKISFLSLFDIANPVDSTKTFNIWGSLWGFTAEYDVTQNLKFLLGITNIEGKDDHPDKESYRFNQMESFSHLRMELKYFF